MFVLSKVGWQIVLPSNLIFVAVAIGIFLTWRGRVSAGISWIKGGLLAAVVMGMLPINALLAQRLETRFPRPDLASDVITGIIMLGGAEEQPRNARRELLALNEAAERITETAALARRFPEARIVLSGGLGSLDPVNAIPDAEQARGLLVALGIDPSRLTLEIGSRNTYENAYLTAGLVKPKVGERWLLVTSAWHMPRAMGCFQRVGIAVEAWPVDYRAPSNITHFFININVAEGLRRTDLILKEYVGLFAYWLVGRTRALWPGPITDAW